MTTNRKRITGRKKTIGPKPDESLFKDLKVLLAITVILLEILMPTFLLLGNLAINPYVTGVAVLALLYVLTISGGVILHDVRLLDIFGFEGLTIWPFIFLRGKAFTKTG